MALSMTVNALTEGPPPARSKDLHKYLPIHGNDLMPDQMKNYGPWIDVYKLAATLDNIMEDNKTNTFLNDLRPLLDWMLMMNDSWEHRNTVPSMTQVRDMLVWFHDRISVKRDSSSVVQWHQEIAHFRETFMKIDTQEDYDGTDRGWQQRLNLSFANCLGDGAAGPEPTYFIHVVREGREGCTAPTPYPASHIHYYNKLENVQVTHVYVGDAWVPYKEFARTYPPISLS